MNFNNAIDIVTDFLREVEGFRSTSYWDSNGYAIAYGNHFYLNGNPVQSGDTISLDQAQPLLRSTAISFANQVLARISAPLTDNELAALTSLTYNCGTVTNALANLINQGADKGVIGDQFLKTCITSGGIYNSDLVDRREKEWALYNNSGFGLSGLLLLAALAGGGYLLYKHALT